MTDVKVQWVEKLASERDALESLARQYKMHPLAFEDCLHSNQRAKFDDFETHQLVVWFAFLDGTIYELEFVVFSDLVLLVTHLPCPGGMTWREYLSIGEHRDAFHMLYQALDKSMDHTANEVSSLLAAVGQFEENILLGRNHLQGLLRLKKKISRVEWTVNYLAPLIAQLQDFLSPKDDLRWRLRDLWDHCERTHQALIFQRKQIAEAMETYWAVTAKRTNAQIKTLTLIACIVLPLTLWTSFWGMNFTAIPFESRRLFCGALLIMGASVGVTYLFLKRKGFWGK